MTYGTSCAPYLATRVVKQLACDERETFPLASRCLLQDIYMDDVLSGTNELNELLELKEELISIFATAGMRLCKFVSNAPELIASLPAEELQNRELFTSLEPSSIKTLGLHWQPVSDLLCFSIREDICVNSTVLTKRIVSSAIGKLFDPLGLLSPVTIVFKMFLQKLWLIKVDWDDKLPKEEAQEWLSMRQNLSELERVTIPRNVIICSPVREEL